MGAPLILSKNRNNSPEKPPTNVTTTTEEPKAKPEAPEHEEDTAVNGKLDINIKDNSINGQSDATRYQQFTDFRHNYH